MRQYRFLNALKRFRRDEDASMVVEAVLILPLLAWAFVGTYTIFEAFRIQTLNFRNGYVVADALSRETDYVNPDYIEGLNNLFQAMSNSPSDTILRVTTVQWDEETAQHTVDWSYASPGKTALEDGTLSQIIPHIPLMADAETVIVVESWMDFEPLMNIGIEPFVFEQINVTRPRFAPKLAWSDT